MALYSAVRPSRDRAGVVDYWLSSTGNGVLRYRCINEQEGSPLMYYTPALFARTAPPAAPRYTDTPKSP